MSLKFLKESSGGIAEESAIQSSAGAGDASKLVATDADGLIDESFLPAGVYEPLHSEVMPASENLSAGDLVNVFSDAGTLKARKASATDNTKPADGYVEAAVTSGNNATVIYSGENDNRSGMTVGAKYWLATTGGGITDTAPSASGNVVQPVGKALSATKLLFHRGEPITKA